MNGIKRIMRRLRHDARTVSLVSCLVCLSLCPFADAGTHYVDNVASGANDGTSWTDAWESFADINWAGVAPGDIVYISGGTSSKTYHEMLDVGADGTPASPIVVTVGADPGHDGDVILDGQLTLSYGVRVENHDYVTVRGLRVDNFTGSGQIRVRYSEGVIVENNEVYVTGHGGVYLHSNTGAQVRNNRITTPGFSTAQTDGIYSQLNTGNLYEHNHIVISNDETNGHDDGIQMYRDTDITLRYNYIEQDNTKTSNAQGIYATESYGTIEAYGNVVYGPNTWNGLLTLRIISEGNAKMIAYHNTLVGGGWGTLILDDAPDSIVKNNILVNYKSGGWVFRLYPGVQPGPANIDYNLYYAPNSTIIASYDGVGKTWTEWKSYGYAAHGFNADPLLENIANRNFALLEGSPAIDVGLNLGAPYNIDINGISRPQGSSSDMGAYEYLSSPSDEGCFVLDGYGGVYAGGSAELMSPGTPYFGWDIAKDLELASAGFYVLDGLGGVHAGGGAAVMNPGAHYFGWDIAEDLELAGTGCYVLDGLGGLHTGGGTGFMNPATPYFGWNIAKDLELASTGFYVLDGFGGVHAGGGAAVMNPATPYFGWDIARDLELASTGFYLLDGFGGVHSGGGATAMNPAAPYFGWDIARDLELASTGFYVLDGLGGVHAGGGASPLSPATPYFGWDTAKDLELTN